MGYRDDFYAYVRENKDALKSVLPINPDKLTDEDLRILCNYATYRAGEGHYQANGSRVDPTMLDDVRMFFGKQPTRMHALSHIHKAFGWYLKGCLNQPNLHKALYDRPNFSPAVEAFVRKHQKKNARDSFKKLSKRVHQMKKDANLLYRLLKSDADLKSPWAQKFIQDKVKAIGAHALSCNRMARAGIAWGVWEGIPEKTAIAGVQTVYLNDLPKIQKALHNCEAFLKTQGIKCNASSKLLRSQNQWDKTLKEILDTVKDDHSRKKEMHYAPQYSA